MGVSESQDLRKQAVITHSGAGTEDLINFGTLYPFLPAPDDLQIVSTSINDAAAGTGAQTVELALLEKGGTDPATWDFYSHTITVTLNGTTPVPIPNPPRAGGAALTWYRCNDLRLDTAGSGGVAAGDITLSAVNGDTEIMARILAGGSRDGQCIFTVPSDESTVISGAIISLNDPANVNDNGVGTLQTRLDGKAWVQFGASIIIDQDAKTATVRIGTFPFRTGKDVRWRATSTTASSSILGSFLVERQQRERIATFGADRNL